MSTALPGHLGLGTTRQLSRPAGRKVPIVRVGGQLAQMHDVFAGGPSVRRFRFQLQQYPVPHGRGCEQHVRKLPQHDLPFFDYAFPPTLLATFSITVQ